MIKNIFIACLFLLSACKREVRQQETSTAVAQSNNELMLSEQQEQLGNISTVTISKQDLGDTHTLPATVNFDQSKITTISARVMGRVERLYFKSIGELVRKGNPLYAIYSEELNNAKLEYLLALEKQNELGNAVIDFGQLVQSARNKLLLWGMTQEQVSGLTSTKDASPLTTIYSNSTGYITGLELAEGDYVMEGGAILQLADLSTLWVEAQVYNEQQSILHTRGMARISIAGIPGLEIKGRVEFINPEIDPSIRFTLARVTIANPGNIKPGMQATIIIQEPSRNMLSVPADAVIYSNHGASVWVKIGEHSFKNVMVETGFESGNRIEIRSGLNEGDEVVVTGAYLLNSEYIFQKGANPMQGHDM